MIEMIQRAIHFARALREELHERHPNNRLRFAWNLAINRDCERYNAHRWDHPNNLANPPNRCDRCNMTYHYDPQKPIQDAELPNGASA